MQFFLVFEALDFLLLAWFLFFLFKFCCFAAGAESKTIIQKGSGVSTDQEIATRLAKLSQGSATGGVPSDDQLRERLARLKGSYKPGTANEHEPSSNWSHRLVDIPLIDSTITAGSGKYSPVCACTMRVIEYMIYFIVNVLTRVLESVYRIFRVIWHRVSLPVLKT